jgi:hypothetical protein
MISPVDICNQALAHLGDRRIHRLDEDAQVTDAIVRYCSEYYEQSKQEVLAAHRWTFAKKAVALSRAVGDTVFKYNFSHVLPTDMLRFLEMLEQDTTDPGVVGVEGVTAAPATGTLTITGDVRRQYVGGENISVNGFVITISDLNLGFDNMIDSSLFSGDLTNIEAAQVYADVINGVASSVPNLTIVNPVTISDVSASVDGSGGLIVTADAIGLSGNSIAVTENLITGGLSVASWDNPTLTGGVEEVIEVIAVDPTYSYSRKVDQFRIVGDKVWSNVENLGLFYVQNVDDPDQWTPHFRACVARLLASYLAGPVADNPNEAQNQLNIYERITLPNAQFYDAVQDNSNENSDIQTRRAQSPLLQVRYRGGGHRGTSSDEPITPSSPTSDETFYVAP